MKQDEKIQDVFEIQGVLIGTKHTYKDFGLYVESKDIPLPTPKTNYVDIPYADGSIDLTEALGEVKYNNRSITINLFTIKPIQKWEQYKTELANYLHGKKFKIIFDADDQFYYVGRVSIEEQSCNKLLGKIVLKCDCEPYKYKIKETVLTYNVNNTNINTCREISIKNSRMTVIPTIETNKPLVIKFEEKEITINEGKHTLLDVVFKYGINKIKLSADDAIVKITYQEGDL